MTSKLRFCVRRGVLTLAALASLLPAVAGAQWWGPGWGPGWGYPGWGGWGYPGWGGWGYPGWGDWGYPGWGAWGGQDYWHPGGQPPSLNEFLRNPIGYSATPGSRSAWRP